MHLLKIASAPMTLALLAATALAASPGLPDRDPRPTTVTVVADPAAPAAAVARATAEARRLAPGARVALVRAAGEEAQGVVAGAAAGGGPVVGTGPAARAAIALLEAARPEVETATP